MSASNLKSWPVPASSKISIEEYLERERAAPYKSEYYKGEMFAMAGASDNHNDICSNIIGLVNPFLRGKKCKVRGSDQRVHVMSQTFFTYPDAVIVCGGGQYLDKTRVTITNAQVIFEVLSRSTQHYDRNEKFDFYKSIDSFSEYILVSSEKFQVEIFRKGTNGDWVSFEYKSFQDQFRIEKIGYEMKLADLYDGVDL